MCAPLPLELTSSLLQALRGLAQTRTSATRPMCAPAAMEQWNRRTAYYRRSMDSPTAWKQELQLQGERPRQWRWNGRTAYYRRSLDSRTAWTQDLQRQGECARQWRWNRRAAYFRRSMDSRKTWKHELQRQGEWFACGGSVLSAYARDGRGFDSQWVRTSRPLQKKDKGNPSAL